MARVSIYLRTDRLDSFGRAPIQIKVWEGKKPPYYHKVTNVNVDPALWDEEICEVLSPHVNAALINRKIRMDRLKVDQALLDMDMAGVDFSKDYLRRNLQGHDDKSVYDFWDGIIIDRKGTISPGTMRNFVTELSKIKQFKPTLYFSEITLGFLERYESWMKSERGNKPNTIEKTMKKFQYVIERANKTIGVNCKSFQLYKKPHENTRRNVLDLVTIDKMIAVLYKNVLDKEQHDVLAIFLLQALTGLRFGDAVRFNKREFVRGGNIIINTGKTGEPVYIPIVGRLQELLEYQHYAFTGMELYNANRHLKSIQLQFSIPFILSTHIAVHTFCTTALELGMSIEIIAKIRGHKNIRTTQIYTHVTNAHIEREMLKAWGTPVKLKIAL